MAKQNRKTSGWRWGALAISLCFGLWSVAGLSPVVGQGAVTPGSDQDGDGLTDQEEIAFGSDPAQIDTDGDGLTDREEFEAGTDPQVRDVGLQGAGCGSIPITDSLLGWWLLLGLLGMKRLGRWKR